MDSQKDATENLGSSRRSVADFDGVVLNDHGDRIIPAKHFGLCPFHELTIESFGSSLWSLSRGGRPVPDGVWTITIFHRDEHGRTLPILTQDKWMMPDCFSMLFDHFEKYGDSQRVQAIRNALKLD
jgi:hypothetical protein